MIQYEVTIRPDNGAIEFWTNDVELRLAVSKMIIDIAEDFSRQRSVSRLLKNTRQKGEQKMKPIIDVSKHNGLLDWEAIQPQIEGAILRIGYRGYSSTGKIVEDKTFEYNESECYRLGIPREYYYFPQDLSYSECVESAVWLMYRLRIYKDLPITIWLDSELAHHGDGRADNLSRKDRTDRLLDIKNIINRLFPTWTIGIYASNSWIKDHLIYEDILSAGVPLWVARYNNFKGPSYPYRYWQYRNNGSLKGCSCAFDFSVRQGEKIETIN